MARDTKNASVEWGGGGGGESTKMYIKIFFSRIRGKNGSGNNSNLKKTLLNLCLLKKGDKAVLQ